MKMELVTLDCPFTQLENPESREAFIDMQRVRASAYVADFGDRFLPFDGSDFVARHHVFYLRTTEGGAERRLPVASFKIAELSRCDTYGLELPVMRFFGKVEPHATLLRQLITQHRASGRALLYTGSWGVLKEHRVNRRLMVLLRDLVSAVLADEVLRTSGFALGIPLEPKTLRFWAKQGCKPLSFEGKPLSTLPHPSAADQRCVLAGMAEPTAEALRCREVHASTLSERRWIL